MALTSARVRRFNARSNRIRVVRIVARYAVKGGRWGEASGSLRDGHNPEKDGKCGGDHTFAGRAAEYLEGND
jgi:hypothetical protein